MALPAQPGRVVLRINAINIRCINVHEGCHFETLFLSSVSTTMPQATHRHEAAIDEELRRITTEVRISCSLFMEGR
jgi:hypothetical protein